MRSGTALIVAATAAFGGFLFGYDSAVVNGAVGPIARHFGAGPAVIGLAVASALLGAAAGALITGKLADARGRLVPMRLAAVLFTVSALGAGLSDSLALLSLFRIVGGFAIGIASVIAPAYIAEIAPAENRGQLGSLQQLAIVTGIFVSLLVDYAIASAAGSAETPWLFGLAAWRWMLIVMVVPAAGYGILSFSIPESPRYLVARGRSDDASRILTRMLGPDGMAAKIAQIAESLVSDHAPNWHDLRGPAFGLLPIVWVGIGLSVFQQFVGINVIFYYSSVLWHAVGFSESDSLAITVITSVVNIATTFIAIALIDRVGRRPLLLIGSAGMAVTLGALTVIFANAPLNAAHQPQLTGSAGVIALWAANLFVVSFGMSWGPVVWVLLGEKFPNRVRAAGLAVAACAQWLANWAITTTFPTLQSLGLGLAYGLYTAFAVLSFFLRVEVRIRKQGSRARGDDQPRALAGCGLRLGLRNGEAALFVVAADVERGESMIFAWDRDPRFVFGRVADRAHRIAAVFDELRIVEQQFVVENHALIERGEMLVGTIRDPERCGNPRDEVFSSGIRSPGTITSGSSKSHSVDIPNGLGAAFRPHAFHRYGRTSPDRVRRCRRANGTETTRHPSSPARA